MTARPKTINDIAPIKTVRDFRADTASYISKGFSMNSRLPATARKQTPEKELGLGFAKLAMILGQSKGQLPQAAALAKANFGDDSDVTRVLKAAVSAGSVSDPAWAGALVDHQRLTGEFIDYLRPQTILGQFGTSGIPSLRRVPFMTSIPRQLSGGNGYWVGEGAPAPLSSFNFDNVSLDFSKLSTIVASTKELLRFSNPAAETIIRDQLAAAIIARLDVDFVDPAKAAGGSGSSPASVTYGVAPIASSGVDADAIIRDVKAVFAKYLAERNPPKAAVWIMPATIAFSLSLMRNAFSEPEFPGISLEGGSFFGIDVIVSDHVPARSVVLVNASDVFLADDGLVTIDVSSEASLQFDSAPTNNSIIPTATNLVSLFQTSSVAFKATRYVNWLKRRTEAAQLLTGVQWGDLATT